MTPEAALAAIGSLVEGAEVAAEHQAELDDQKQAAAAELRDVEEKTQAEIAKNIRSRLLQLATRKRN